MRRRALVCWQWLAHWIERLTPVFVLIGVIVLALLVLKVFNQQDRLRDQQHALTQQQQQIREQRAYGIRVSCEETNDRNRNTVHEYDTRIAKIAPKLPPEQRAQLKQSRAFTVGLINALQPREDCNARVRRLSAVGEPQPSSPTPPPTLAR